MADLTLARVPGPCSEHGCSLCCRQALVTLTEADVVRIAALGHRRTDFISPIGEFLALRHGPEGCLFLREDRCSIHTFRPDQCRTYPILAGEDGEPVRDLNCPHAAEFPLDPQAASLNAESLTREEREAAARRMTMTKDPDRDPLPRHLRERIGWVTEGETPDRD